MTELEICPLGSTAGGVSVYRDGGGGVAITAVASQPPPPPAAHSNTLPPSQQQPNNPPPPAGLVTVVCKSRGGQRALKVVRKPQPKMAKKVKI